MTRERAPAERKRRRIALAVSLLFNATFIVVLDFGMRPRPGDFLAKTQAIRARLIERAEPTAAPTFEPPSEPLVLLPTPAPRRIARPRPIALRDRVESAAPLGRVETAAPRDRVETTAHVDASTAPQTSSAEVPPLRLVDRDGRILLPDATTPAAPSSSVAIDEPPLRDAFARRNPVPYTPTRFDKYFPPVDETLGGEIVRRTTVTHTWLTPWGTQITCSTFFFVLGGCGWGYAPQLSADEMHAMHADPPPSPLLPQPPATPVPNAKFSIVR